MLLPRVSVLCLVWATLAYQVDDALGIWSILGGFGAGGATSVGLSTASAALAAGGLAAAAAGVAGVGLAALAFSVKKGRGNDDSYTVYQHGYHSGGYSDHHQDHHHDHGHGGGYGGGGGYGQHHRRRSARSTRLSPDETSLAKMFSVVANMDTYGCGLKLVCELYRVPNKLLNDREQSVKNLLGGHQHVEGTRDPRYAYVTAAALGKQGFDCTQVYAKCPLTQTQVRDYLNSLQI